MEAMARSSERGQVSVLFALCIVVVFGLMVGIATAGRIAVERARARAAADAVALAGADPVAQQMLRDRWVKLGAEVEIGPDTALAVSGQAQARAWVLPGAATVQRAPALVALVARAEQLLGGGPLVPIAWGSRSVTLAPDDARRFDLLAVEFGLCRAAAAHGATSFELC